MKPQWEKRLAALEAKTKAVVGHGGSGVVINMGDGRWYGGGSFHASKEAALVATERTVKIIIDLLPGGLDGSGVLAAAISEEASPDVYAEITGASSKLPPLW